MPGMMSRAFSLLVGDDVRIKKPAFFSLSRSSAKPFGRLTDRELLQMESEIGKQLFGPIPHGHRREFFCLDAHTWIWHEEWVDQDNRIQLATTRYEIQQNGVLKIQEGARYSYLDGDELDHLLSATRIYYERVAREVYRRDPETGVKLASDLI